MTPTTTELPEFDFTPLIHLAVKLGIAAVVILFIVGWLRSWWDNRAVAAPKVMRGTGLELIVRVFRGASTVWDDQLISAGLFIRSAAGVQRPKVVSGSQTVLQVAPAPGTMPRWLTPSAMSLLEQIADHPVRVRQLGNRLEIRLAD